MEAGYPGLNQVGANLYEDSILIEELPAGTRLLYRADGSIVIAGSRENGNPLLYSITPAKNLKDRSCRVRRMATGNELLEDVAPVGGTHGLHEDYAYEPLLPTLFPSLDETRLRELSAMGDEMAMELAAILTRHPAINARHYPVQYVALILWSDNGPAKLASIENAGGNITTDNLQQALGINKLTTGMKQFIRHIQPDLCKRLYIETVTNILREWNDFGRIFSSCSQMPINLFDIEAIYQLTRQYPSLLKAKWYEARKLIEHNGYIIYQTEWIERAYTFYLDSRNSNRQPIPDTATDINTFLCRHIRSHWQLKNLINQAESVFTEDSDHWLLESYPDARTFDHLPVISDTDLFRLIRTAGELRDIAKTLKNCAAGFLHEAIRGTVVFFAYEYTPDKYPGGPLFDDPDYPVTGLLALRHEPLNHWMKTAEAPDWIDIDRKLVLEFKGIRNKELGPSAWRHLEGFLSHSLVNTCIINSA